MRLKRRLSITVALALSVMVGFVTPLGDVAQARAVMHATEPEAPAIDDGPVAGTDTGDDPQADEPDLPGSGDERPSQDAAGTADETAGQSAEGSEEGQRSYHAPSVADGTETAPSTELEDPSLTDETTAAPRSITPFSSGATGCNYADAGSGAYAQTLCWFDFSRANGQPITTEYTRSVETNQSGILNRARYVYTSVLGSAHGTVNGAYGYPTTGTPTPNSTIPSDILSSGGRFYGNVTNYPITVTLQGGYVMTAQLNITGTGNGRAMSGHPFPTWSGAFLGNNNFYTGVAGNPAMYQTIDRGNSTVALNNIQLTANGVLTTGFSIVVADAESTDSNESLTWSRDNGTNFSWLPNTPGGTTKTETMGNACPASYAPAIGSTAAQASCDSNTSSNKNGTAMLMVSPTQTTGFNVRNALVGGGLQGIGMGIIIAQAQTTVTVTDRIVGTDGTSLDNANFSATMSGALSPVTAETLATGDTATTAPRPVLVVGSGSQLQFASATSGGRGADYTAAWQCSKVNPDIPGTLWWPSASTTSPTPPAADADFTRLNAGQFLHCTVTYTPPYVTLVKHVENVDTDATNTAADWNLTATGPASLATSNGTGEKRAVAVGNYSLAETGPTSDPWVYGYDWTDLSCAAQPGSTAMGAFSTTNDTAIGVVTGGSLSVAQGNDLRCTFTNTAREPQLIVAKDAAPATGTPLSQGATVSYRLTFDNEHGTASVEVDHVDHLRDVLDDADFVPSSIRYSDGQEAGYPSDSMSSPGIDAQTEFGDADSPEIRIQGAVPRGQTRTVWFQVTVKPNAENAESRQAASAPFAGYVLRNYVTAAGEEPPTTCEPGGSTLPDTCTEHPVQAWAMSKNSFPANGARLHAGGNVHYRIAATKMTAETEIDGLIFSDDLTQVFQTAGWAPDAAVPGGALPRGIYFFNESGDSLDASGNVNGSAAAPVAAYSGDAGVPAPTQSGGRWTIASTQVDVPAAAMRAEMWFAVQGGQNPAGIPAEWSSHGTPQSGWTFVNYVTGTADLQPNQCSTSETTPPALTSPTENPIDTSFPAMCRVNHELRDNFFTIRKDAQGAGDQLPRSADWGIDPTGLWNMINHEFEIQDDVDGAPSGVPSAKFCWTGYNPGDPSAATPAWDGQFTGAGSPDWGEDSATLAAIRAWNAANPDDELPLCALFYAQDPTPPSGQTGRWRSENLPAGDYWLFETKAPDQQINTLGTARRDVPGVQLLAEPIAFSVWPDAEAPPFGNGQSQHGLGQLDVSDGSSGYLDRCIPGVNVELRPVACVNPTGYLMIVKDAVPLALPLSGGFGPAALTAAGVIVVVVALGGALWWRRRTQLLHTPQDGTVQQGES